MERDGQSAGIISETGRLLLTEEHIVRDITCCAIYAGNTQVWPTSSNSEPDFESHLPAYCHLLGVKRGKPECRKLRWAGAGVFLPAIPGLCRGPASGSHGSFWQPPHH